MQESGSNPIFGDLLLQGFSHREGLEGQVFVVRHALLLGRSIKDELDELEVWLKDNCTDRFFLFGMREVAFQSLDDAMMFKLKFGGTLIEKDLS